MAYAKFDTIFWLPIYRTISHTCNFMEQIIMICVHEEHKIVNNNLLNQNKIWSRIT